ncbi:DUF992 domain-containing protein [Pseudorhodoplanes sp.]|uniref:DUF992 domain-containing protein n=1 Tax=Pseudorhodoplanes sp. TaxID=1934341 RepID=UPI00391B8A04
MRSILLTVIAAVTLGLLNSSADAQSRIRVGGLTCDLAPTVGMIVGSWQQARCIFRPTYGRPERYYASLSRLGVDLGVKHGGRLYWAVFAPTSALPPRTLAGNYVGAAGDVSFGVGGGANVLVGGSRRTISLQPLSLTAQRGVNVAGGVAHLVLR